MELFGTTGQERRAWLDGTINNFLREYLGPTGIPDRVNALNEIFNPVVGIEQSGQAFRNALRSDLPASERALEAGKGLLEVAGVVAPAAGVAYKGGAATADDLARAVEDVYTGVAYGAPGQFAADEFGGIRAWHGSPHDFDEFSLDKIGTGEGAQAYGHGLYFAENKATAESYQEALSRNIEQLREISKGAGLEGDAAEMLAFQYSQNNFHGKGFDAWFDDLLKSSQDGLLPPRTRKAVEDLLDMRPEASEAVSKMKTPGRLYEVEINANPEDFLDWDAPLSAQPEAVRRLADTADISSAAGPTRVRLSRYRVGEDDPNDPAIGQHLHRALSDYGDETARATELMREAGIPGIRYLDQGSRGTGDGTRNYVVFDDNLISIIKKYGIAGAAAMLGLSSQDLQAQAADAGVSLE